MIGYFQSQSKEDPNMKHEQIYQLSLAGLLTGLILTSTIMFRIPMPFTNGYVHLGDTMIFLAVLVLGKKYGCLAAGIGSALADLLAGYTHYVPWTFAIKALMALMIGIALEHFAKNSSFSNHSAKARLLEAVALIPAGLEMIVGYYVAASIMRGNWVTPLLSVPGNIAQYIVGAAVAAILAAALQQTSARRYFAIHM